MKPAVPHTVTYNYSANGGTPVTETSAEVLEGAAVDLTPTAAKDGWEFVGWNTDQNAHEGLTSLTMGETDVTLYVIYQKTLSASFYSGSAGGFYHPCGRDTRRHHGDHSHRHGQRGK